VQLTYRKPFDKVNHYALFIKLMKLRIPVKVLLLLEKLFSICYSRIKWNSSWSEVFKIDFRVRQGSVLSPLMFALYVDDLGKLCDLCRGCCVILYADDILLIAPTVTQLENLLHICERELQWLDMAINFKKSCCLHIGPRCDEVC